MEIESVEPEGWAPPRGYANGLTLKGADDLVFVAGQIAWDAEQKLVGRDDFAVQFEQALANVVAVVRTAGAEPSGLVQMTIYVTDKKLYLTAARQLGEIWRRVVGKTYPTMALVQVADLLEDGALVEIQAIAAR